MTIPFRDVELLSAYLDGQLSPADVVRLEARLAVDKDLKAVLDDLRPTRSLLRQLPSRRAPRNFTLTPKMAGIRPPPPRAYSALRFATALAGLLFVVSIAINGLIPLAAARVPTAAPPAYGIGGGGGAEPPALQAAPAATQAPAASMAQPAATEAGTPAAELPLAPAPTINPTTAAEDHAQLPGTATPEVLTKSLAAPTPIRQPVENASRSPVPLSWLIVLGGLAAICGMGAWWVRSRSERDFKRRSVGARKDQ